MSDSGPFHNTTALGHAMAGRHTDDKPLCEPALTQIYGAMWRHHNVYVTRIVEM